jgi:hypothetical protein
MHCIAGALLCIALHCTALHCIAGHCTALQGRAAVSVLGVAVACLDDAVHGAALCQPAPELYRHHLEGEDMPPCRPPWHIHSTSIATMAHP